jgi:Cof subfamily protein (haloacid dehalogenase superfamily)
MIKLVLCDVDGTLIPLGSHGASARTMQAIFRVREAGVRFGLSTGRDVVELMQLFDGNDIAFRTGILSNGKKVMVDGEIARLSLISNEGLVRLAAKVTKYPGVMLTVYPFETDATNPIYCLGTTAEEMAQWAKIYSFNGILTDAVPPIKIIGATIACPDNEEIMQAVERDARELCPEFDIAKPSVRWWDILPKGLNKGTALQILMDKLDITSDEVVVFGDADNDLAILRSVENSVVVDGATPAAKAAAKWHIGACEDDAVADALEDIARAAREGGAPAFMCN